MMMFVVIEITTKQANAFPTRDKAIEYIQERLIKLKQDGQIIEPIGAKYSKVVSLSSHPYDIFHVYKCGIQLNTNDELRNFAALAYENDGPERDAIRDILKK